MITCEQCGITTADVKDQHPEDYFTPVDVVNQYLCTTCVDWNGNLDRSIPAPTRLSRLLSTNNRRTRILRERLRLAENVAALFDDHLLGCVATTVEEDAVIEWRHAAGIAPVPDDSDDYPRRDR